MSEHPIVQLSRRYPSLLLPIREGMKDSEQYKNAVLRGQQTEGRPDFSLNEKDSLASFVTPAGAVDVLFLQERADFVHAIRALAYRCEPKPVPDSMGASSLSGLINWEKIRRHLEEYCASGGEDENAEFARFTSEKSNYLDCLIVLSSGPYSAVPAADMGLEEEEWLSRSLRIRKFHELTHFFSRHLYLENKDAVRDEILADLIGIVSAFGFYDDAAARRFLGLEGEEYREGGRLQNYCSAEELPAVIVRARTLISVFKDYTGKNRTEDVFALLGNIEKNKIGLA